jgi:hypothetical protein
MDLSNNRGEIDKAIKAETAMEPCIQGYTYGDLFVYAVASIGDEDPPSDPEANVVIQ